MKRSASVEQRELQWQERLAHQARSGQSIAAYCRDHGIAVQTFYWWRAKLGDGRRQPSRSTPRQRTTAPFIDLGALAPAEDTRGMADNFNIRLELPGGIMLTIARR